MKSQEQRIKDAAVAIARAHNHSERVTDYDRAMAQTALEAADREPQWPTDDSVNEYHAAYVDEFGQPPCGTFEMERELLRAPLLADPIIKAAIDYRDAMRPDMIGASEAPEELIRAVDEAGL